MPRPRSRRKVSYCPCVTYFKPRGVPLRDLRVVKLNEEEVEALRLKNIKNFNQIECAEKMNTSQSTFQRIINSAYEKISVALVDGMAIEIEQS